MHFLGMLDHIMVEHYGVRTSLHRIAVGSVLDPKTQAITPYVPNALKELEKAIISSPLGLNPKPDNQRLIVPIPPQQHFFLMERTINVIYIMVSSRLYVRWFRNHGRCEAEHKESTSEGRLSVLQK